MESLQAVHLCIHLPFLLFAITLGGQETGCSLLGQCGPLVADICMSWEKDGLIKGDDAESDVRAVY